MRAALFLAAVVLSGCALKSPPTHTDVVEQALPKTTRIPPAWRADPRDGEVTNDWLKSFNDPMLDAIVAEAIANNLDLRAAATKVAIAQQTVVIVGSRLMPWVGVQLGASSTYERDDGAFHSSSAFVGAAWELDVWGRMRAAACGRGSERRSRCARLCLCASVARSDNGQALVPRRRDPSATRAQRAGRQDLWRVCSTSYRSDATPARTPTSMWSTCARSSRRRRAMSNVCASRTAKCAARSRWCWDVTLRPR